MPNYNALAHNLLPELEPYLLSRDGTRELGRGTAFPASADLPDGLLAGDRFYRTDLNWPCVYDGTRWLTQFEVAHPLVEASGVAAFAVRSPLRTDYIPYFTRVSFRAFITGTNNGSNYWTLTVQTTDAQITAATNIRVQATNADGAGAWLVYDLAPTTNVPAAGNIYWLRLNCTVTGAPGSLAATAIAHYRQVVT